MTQTYLTTNNTDKLIVNSNPFRYRGYYYDSDTQLYYLQTRYYNPANGRFLNSDIFVSTDQGFVGNNMYAYCCNSPIINIDPTGDFAWLVFTIIVACTITGAIMGATSDVDLTSPQNIQENNEIMVEDGLENEESEELSVGVRIKNAILGAGTGLLVGGAIVATGGVVMGAIGGASVSLAGATAAQTFALGALAYNLSAICIMPFYGIEMEPIEYEPLS